MASIYRENSVFFIICLVAFSFFIIPTTLALSSAMNTLKPVAQAIMDAKLGKYAITNTMASLNSIRDGYGVQKELMGLSSASGIGKVAGWKIGATNDASVKKLGFGPFYSPLFSSNIFNSDDKAKASMAVMGASFRGAEAEIAFCLDDDFPKLPLGRTYEAAEVLKKVKWIAPAIELSASRFASSIALSPAMMLADFGLNGCVVLGRPQSYGGTANDLAGIKVELLVDGSTICAGESSNVLSNPLYSLTWLINELNKDDQIPLKDHVVITGAIVNSPAVQPGQLVTAVFRGVFSSGSATKEIVNVRLEN